MVPAASETFLVEYLQGTLIPTSKFNLSFSSPSFVHPSCYLLCFSKQLTSKSVICVRNLGSVLLTTCFLLYIQQIIAVCFFCAVTNLSFTGSPPSLRGHSHPLMQQSLRSPHYVLRYEWTMCPKHNTL